MEKIDMNEWTLFSDRLNSASYHNADKTLLLKKVHDVAKNTAEQEFRVAKKAYDSGLTTPEPIKLVSCGDETGIIFEYIDDKKSYTRACTENPDKFEEYMREWGGLVKELHETSCDTSVFPNQHELVMEALEKTDLVTEEERIELIKLLEGLENTGTFLLIDINPSNFIYAGQKKYIIDLNELCYGNPMLDLSFYYYLLFGMSDEIKKALGTQSTSSFALLEASWSYLLREHFGTEDEAELAEIEKEIQKYSPIMGIYFLSHMGFLKK